MFSNKTYLSKSLTLLKASLLFNSLYSFVKFFKFVIIHSVVIGQGCGISVYGKRETVLSWLEERFGDVAADALSELKALSELLDRLPCGDRIIFDFSVVNNMSYYNGIVFTGFLSGISDSVLAGGQYDKLMQKLNRKSSAIGFAVYLDLLERLTVQQNDYDVDILLLYAPETPCAVLTETVERLVKEGKSVCAQKNIPARLRYREIIRLEGTVC